MACCSARPWTDWRTAGTRGRLTDTVPIPEEKRWDGLTVLSIAPLLASAIRAVFEDGSVAELFDTYPEHHGQGIPVRLIVLIFDGDILIIGD